MIEFKNRLTGTLMAVAPEREAEYLAAGHTRVDAPAATPARQPAEEPAAKQTAEEPTEEPTAKQTAAPAPKKKAAARK
ncbi:MAG: hypothetical protein ACLR51_00170 [Subdoligranulum sp.]|jgi:hypothetical protein